MGYTSQGANGLDIWVAKLNAADLATVSSMTLNSSGAADDDARGVALDASGNVYVTGRSSAPGLGYVLWMGKFGPALNFISSATYNIPQQAGGAGAPKAGLLVEPGGDIVTTASTLIGGNWKILVARFSPSLALVSSTTFFNGFNANEAFGVDRDSSGNLYVAGYAAPAPATSGNIWVGKFSSSLVFVTSASLAGAGGNSDQALEAKVDPTNTYLFVSGVINNTTLIGDLWLAKYDLSLNLLKQASYRGVGNGASIGIAEVVTDTRVYVGGNWHTTALGDSVYLGVFDYNLNALSSATYDTGSASNDNGWALAVDTAARMAYVGGYVTPAANMQPWIGKFPLGPAPLTGISLSQSSVTLTQGQSVQLGATGAFEGGTSRALVPSDALQWSVSHSSVATVSANGLVTAVGGGSAWLTVSSGTVRAGGAVGVSAAVAGCGLTRNVRQDGTADDTTIQAAVNALPTDLSSTTCVVIRDANTYAEQVTVQGFANNGYQLKIMADPSFVGLAPAVSPPVASTAAFQIMNASVSIQGINVIPTDSVPYGVTVSSMFVTISSVNVIDLGGKILTAGMRLGSYDTVLYSSMTVAISSYGFYLNGSSMTTVSHSRVFTNNHLYGALDLVNSSSNTFSVLIASNAANYGCRFVNSDFNAINDSGLYGESDGLYLGSSSFNIFERDFIRGFSGGASLNQSGFNTISQSTVSGNGALTLNNHSSTNTFQNLYFPYWGVSFNGASNYNRLSQSHLAQGPLDFTDSSFNTVENTIVAATGDGVYYSFSSNYNIVTHSTITLRADNSRGFVIDRSSSNVINDCFVVASTAVYLMRSTDTVIAYSTLVSTRPGSIGLHLGQS
ncbi:MAG: hypothetical protein A3J79_05885, partial [Elusimicrobia bacterium RIFOXYB2_FULL_62_6]